MAMEYKKREKMRKNFLYIPVILGLIFSLSSCRSVAPRLDYKALARASVRLGIDIRLEDNHKLYLEAAEWIGVPYRIGGDSKRGTDCSGFTSHIYKKYTTRNCPAVRTDKRKRVIRWQNATCGKAIWSFSPATTPERR